MSLRTRIAGSAMALGLGMTGITVAFSPAAEAAITCSDVIKHFNNNPAIYAYWGQCSGSQVGVNRDYKWREVLVCYFPITATYNGPWVTSGYSKVACPGNTAAGSHHATYQFI